MRQTVSERSKGDYLFNVNHPCYGVQVPRSTVSVTSSNPSFFFVSLKDEILRTYSYLNPTNSF